MPVIVRNSITGVKVEYPSFSREAYDLINGKRTLKYSPRMVNIQYKHTGTQDKTEVYGTMKVVICGLKHLKGIPKMECRCISPSDLTFLRAFQSSHCDASTLKSAKDDTQRFVLKSKWFRMLDEDGNVIHDSIETILRTGLVVNIEYHMNYMRTDSLKSHSPFVYSDPIIRKIVISSSDLIGYEKPAPKLIESKLIESDSIRNVSHVDSVDSVDSIDSVGSVEYTFPIANTMST